MNIDYLPHLVTTKVLLRGEYVEARAIDTVAYVKHTMAHEMGRELEKRMHVTCRMSGYSDFELTSELWVFNRGQLETLIKVIQDTATRQ